ncbi:galactokinase [Pseudohalioglobus sediminis]|uniref:Galactokinase n=1 Tax=Pseudohalioglobus sediminis TaxID=2606449 RepID=A0A5B0WZN3_9GAMM|nr:galactokinase [Pseudohalioglobus sediminis]KAA1192513.1 galactokinase [Pseudohalioglobus sediminis]
MNSVQRRQRMADAFQQRFSRSATHWVRAPGRVDAMGSHTDYNGGFVLTVPIDRDTWIAAAPRNDSRVRMASLNLPEAAELDLSAVPASPLAGWPVYVQAVIRALQDEGMTLRGCDLLVHGTVPIASGLSSSASLEAASAVLLTTLAGTVMEPVRMALLCQRAENETVGVNCGILDQYSVILGEQGSMLLLDCRDLRHQYAPIPAGLVPVICNTNRHRELSGSEYGERRSSCEQGMAVLRRARPEITCLRDLTPDQFDTLATLLDPLVARRCRFVVEENARVLRMADALRDGDLQVIGELCAASFAGARGLYEITIPEMEQMYAAAMAAPGVVGVRQAGAGFGGCMLALVASADVNEFIAATGSGYRHASGIEADIYPVQPAPGAGLLAQETLS